MTIFEAVKSTVTPRIAAEHYGMTVARNGMVCCPFHDDRHPSMKLNEDYFYCFGCGAKGDVIEFTSKLFGINAQEAAQKLSADFGIKADKPSVLTKLSQYRTQADNERLCFRVLREYLQILQDWKVRFSPQTPDEDPHDRFVEACHTKRGNPMKKPYYKELPLFHIYDSNLTGSQKLLMTLLLIDDTYDMYTLSCLAKLRTEDVIFDLQKLKKRGYFQDR